MMAMAMRGPDPVSEEVAFREVFAELEELPFDFFIRPNIPRPSGNGYFPRQRLKFLPCHLASIQIARSLVTAVTVQALRPPPELDP